MSAKGYRRVIATNRRARYDYELEVRVEITIQSKSW